MYCVRSERRATRSKLAVWLGACLLATVLQAQPPGTEEIVIVGDPYPGGGTVSVLFDGPVIEEGIVAFRALPSEDTRGDGPGAILTWQSGSGLQVLVDTDTTVPDASGSPSFDSFGDLSMDQGTLVFVGRYYSKEVCRGCRGNATSGIFSVPISGGPVTAELLELPDVSFESVGVSADGGDIAVGTEDYVGSVDGGVLTVLAESGDTVPGSAESFSSFDIDVSVSGGEVTFEGRSPEPPRGGSGEIQGHYRAPVGGGPVVLLEDDSGATFGGRTFEDLDEAVVEGGRRLFTNGLTGEEELILGTGAVFTVLRNDADLVSLLGCADGEDGDFLSGGIDLEGDVFLSEVDCEDPKEEPSRWGALAGGPGGSEILLQTGDPLSNGMEVEEIAVDFGDSLQGGQATFAVTGRTAEMRGEPEIVAIFVAEIPERLAPTQNVLEVPVGGPVTWGLLALLLGWVGVVWMRRGV